MVIFRSVEHVRNVRTLYRRILRLQKGLPPELQALGNNYIRDEFKRHKDCDEEQARAFIQGWQEYSFVLSKQLSLKGIARGYIGKDMDPKEIRNLPESSLGQLYELKVETEKPKKPKES